MHIVKRATTHTFMALLEALLIAGMVGVLIAGTAIAGKPGGGKTAGSGTINTVYMDGATEAHYGARVTFAVSTGSTAYPYVHLRCWQNSTLVLDGWQGFFPTALGNQWFYLGPTPSWSGGAAACQADLDKSTSRGGWSVLASTSFAVYP